MLGLLLCFLKRPRARALRPLEAGARPSTSLLGLAHPRSAAGSSSGRPSRRLPGRGSTAESLGNRAGYETLDRHRRRRRRPASSWRRRAARSAGRCRCSRAFFLAYAYFGASRPTGSSRIAATRRPHRGADLPAHPGRVRRGAVGDVHLRVPVRLFGALLGATGATRFVIHFAARAFGRQPGRPGQGGGDQQRPDGLALGQRRGEHRGDRHVHDPDDAQRRVQPEMAAGIEAAASSGGALVPPVMGAGAYMMLEIVQPPVTYLEIVRAAICRPSSTTCRCSSSCTSRRGAWRLARRRRGGRRRPEPRSRRAAGGRASSSRRRSAPDPCSSPATRRSGPCRCRS
jgi:hypothetical protein